MLYRAFLEIITRLCDDNSGSSSSVFPSLFDILSSVLRGSMEQEVTVKLVFPLLFAIGILQAVFFGHHLFYVASAITTLEYKILLDTQFKHLVRNSSASCVTPRNPFNRGWLQNLKNVLGPVVLIFLPIEVNPKEITLIKDEKLR